MAGVLRSLPRWCRRLLLAGAALVLLYAILGFLVAPALVKALAPPRLARFLGRPVALGGVRLNPFALSATLRDFAVKEPDGSEFLGWDRLYVNLGFRSLLGRTMVVKAIELQRPFGRVVAERGGRFNFSDLVERLGGASSRPPSGAEDPRPLRIGRLSVQGARITFLDRGLPEPFATSLSPLSLELTDFSTERDRSGACRFSGRTEKGETFAWSGQISVQPLASRGTLTLGGLLLPKYRPFYRDQVAFRLEEGILSASASYRFQWGQGVHVIRLEDGALDLAGLKVDEGRGAPVIDLPRAEVRGLEADLVERSVRIGSVHLQEGMIAATRAGDGSVNLVRLLTPRPAPHPEPPSAPFKVQVEELRLERFRASFQDFVPPRPVRIGVRSLDLTLRRLSLDPERRADLELSLDLEGKGSIQARGTVAPFTPAADLAVKVAGLELPPFDPYLAPALDVRLDRGALSLDGNLACAFGHPPRDAATFRGSLRLERFEAADGTRGEPFLGCRRLALGGLVVATSPPSLAIRSVDLAEPEQRLVVDRDGTTNVGRALKLEPAPAAGPPLSAVGAALPPSQGPPMKLSIARTRITGGRLSFVDRSLEPNAALLITSLQGAATALSTEPDTQSAVDFQGLVGGLAPLRLQGRAMPLRKDQDTDVAFTIQGSDLCDFTPYAAKYLGYTIQKGKLLVDARVRIERRRLQAQVDAKLDQFYLGDRTSSPDAVHLPVKLCLAILRDRKGVIDLDLPVDGDLDNPDLHYGRIIWHAVLNILGKAAASPFTLLAKLAGGHGDQDLSFVAFEPGSADPDLAAAGKVQALAKALEERPGLNLEARGSVDPVADAAALRRAGLDRLLRGLEAQAGAAPGAAPAQGRDHWLQVAFQRAFKPVQAAGVPVPPPPPPAEMEQQLLGTIPVTADDLGVLADRRAKALLKALQEAHVDPARLFQVGGGGGGAKEAASRVYFGLKD
ncbi:MAG: DUF748 domain-containing protein [Holophaga sp.]